MARFLRDDDVDRCAQLGDMLPVIERMFAQYGQSRAVNLTRRKTVTPHGYLAVMGGALAYDGVMGVKTFTHTHSGYSFQVSLYDIDSGRLLLYTQANRLGQLRTGATTGVAVKHLAVGGALRVGIIGTGNQAADQLRAISSVREVREIVAYSRNPENRRNFAERMSTELEIPIIAGDANRDAVESCDVVVGIASAETPVVLGEWVSSGTTVIGAGPTSPRHREVDDKLLAIADRRFVDSLEQAPLECGDIAGAVDQGIVHWNQFHELRHVVGGTIAGRGGDNEVVYCKLMGTGVADVAAARLILERAEQLGLGVEMDF